MADTKEIGVDNVGLNEEEGGGQGKQEAQNDLFTETADDPFSVIKTIIDSQNTEPKVKIDKSSKANDEEDYCDDGFYFSPVSDSNEEVGQTPRNEFIQSSQEVLTTFDFTEKLNDDENKNRILIPPTPPELTKSQIISVNTVNNMKRDPIYAAEILVEGGHFGIIDAFVIFGENDSTPLELNEEYLNNIFVDLIPNQENATLDESKVNSGTTDGNIDKPSGPSRKFLHDPGQGWLSDKFIEEVNVEVLKLTKEKAEQKWSDENAPIFQNLGKVVQSEEVVNPGRSEISNSDSEPTLFYALGGDITDVPDSSLLIPKNENETSNIIAADNNKLLNQNPNEDDENNSDQPTNNRCPKTTKSSIVHCLAGVQEPPASMVGTYDMDALQIPFGNSASFKGLSTSPIVQASFPKSLIVLNEEVEGLDTQMEPPPLPEDVKANDSDNELNPAFYKKSSDDDGNLSSGEEYSDTDSDSFESAESSASKHEMDTAAGTKFEENDNPKTESTPNELEVNPKVESEVVPSAEILIPTATKKISKEVHFTESIIDEIQEAKQNSAEVDKTEKESESSDTLSQMKSKNMFEDNGVGAIFRKNAGSIFDTYSEIQQISSAPEKKLEAVPAEPVKKEVAESQCKFDGASILEVVAGGLIDVQKKEQRAPQDIPKLEVAPSAEEIKIKAKPSIPIGKAATKSQGSFTKPSLVRTSTVTSTFGTGTTSTETIKTKDAVPAVSGNITAPKSKPPIIRPGTSSSVSSAGVGTGTQKSVSVSVGPAEEKTRIRKCTTTTVPKPRSKSVAVRPITQPGRVLGYGSRRRKEEDQQQQKSQRPTTAASSRGTNPTPTTTTTAATAGRRKVNISSSTKQPAWK